VFWSAVDLGVGVGVEGLFFGEFEEPVAWVKSLCTQRSPELLEQPSRINPHLHLIELIDKLHLQPILHIRHLGYHLHCVLKNPISSNSQISHQTLVLLLVVFDIVMQNFYSVFERDGLGEVFEEGGDYLVVVVEELEHHVFDCVPAEEEYT
jgi:hypothetical protein